MHIIMRELYISVSFLPNPIPGDDTANSNGVTIAFPPECVTINGVVALATNFLLNTDRKAEQMTMPNFSRRSLLLFVTLAAMVLVLVVVMVVLLRRFCRAASLLS